LGGHQQYRAATTSEVQDSLMAAQIELVQHNRRGTTQSAVAAAPCRRTTMSIVKRAWLFWINSGVHRSLLVSRLIFWVLATAGLREQIVPAPAEDTALRGRNRSAAWSGINGRSGGASRPIGQSLPVSPPMR